MKPRHIGEFMHLKTQLLRLSYNMQKLRWLVRGESDVNHKLASHRKAFSAVSPSGRFGLLPVSEAFSNYAVSLQTLSRATDS